MNTEELIKRTQGLLEASNEPYLAAAQDQNNGQVSLVIKGTQSQLCACLISILGSDQFNEQGLSIVGAFCFAKANGLVDYRDPKKFAEYLMNSSKVYAEMNGDKYM